MLKARKRQQGFTLIELMVVVVILAVLAGFVVPKLMDRPDEARIVKAKQDIAAIGSALQLYKLDNYNYPTTDQGLEALVTQPSDDPQPKNWKKLLDTLPIDPWGNPYLYLMPGEHGEFDLYTLGADGMDGGEDVNATIGNWQQK
ncbi:type II secretion system major pseudopilin GspG [Thiomicrorhabdus sp. 6S2-11]|jgi:general secretion pathway protein G|uniref:Type II secretion system core protein G n=1 Tax=Thiomicrorhabdus marina TaxID=2818442 RepID=A0ABS3Q6N2_9GAMM|nr:type II secretion system major pseudopilin GspG [Thiomicrorhabdus marina]MBO1928003.1 type II secretion system major pseudopilin GspG [Thiomicrorhabdus marina]